jgi:lipid-binding SYLF domain-containing protein
MKRLISISTAITAALICSVALADSKTEKRVDTALEVFKTFTEIPESAIPASILKDAYGIAILPGVIKVGFTIGGRYGRGVLMVRQGDDTWSNPAFIAMGGGSVGFQIGAQSTDIILVFRDSRSINNIYNGKLVMGGDASAAAGPVGRQSSASTDERLAAEIYSYSRNRGLFAGVSLEGSWLAMDAKSNEAYYGNGMTPQEILAAENMPTPLSAKQLADLVAATAPRVDGLVATSRTAQASTSAVINTTPTSAAPPAAVKTYALEPLPANGATQGGGDETTF